MIKLFISYAHEDEAYRIALGQHLKLLERQGAALVWHDRKMLPGAPFAAEIDDALAEADIIVFLVSAAFLDSDYCMDVEAPAAIQKARTGTAQVVPVIVRDCLWKRSSLASFNALPRDGKPIATYPDQDVAYREVAEGLLALMQTPRRPRAPAQTATIAAPYPSAPVLPVRVNRPLSQLERDDFRDAAFARIVSMFEASLSAIQTQDAALEGRVTRLDARRFIAAVYLAGKKKAGCTIYSGGGLGDIGFSLSDNGQTNTANETLTVEVRNGQVGLRPLMGGSARDQLFDVDEAANHLWQMFTRGLGH